ncbi:hypothetical protein ES703_42662 [subsurface metagenome]
MEQFKKSDSKSVAHISTSITRALSVIERIAGKKSEYYKTIEEYFKQEKRVTVRFGYVFGSLYALYQDLEKDYLRNLSELIHGDIFSDYLGMAIHLLEEGYKDASAVIAGSTLEEHLRKLCEKNEIKIEFTTSRGIKPKKADVMNSDLTKEGVYPKTQQKQVTAWLGIRNDAAHGHYDKYTNDQVNLMLIGLTDFFVRYPA